MKHIFPHNLETNRYKFSMTCGFLGFHIMLYLRQKNSKLCTSSETQKKKKIQKWGL